ncbi:MAG TPA: hypothetical protein VJS47_07990 [Rhizomicrobium sp.]|nr:hypothetical protein [Rhizomicrobium sp.]
MMSFQRAWLFILLAVPFLAGGVVVGDEALLLKTVYSLNSSALSFGEFARSPDGWYIVHHVLWFALIYLTESATAFLHTGRFATEVIISCQTVIAGLTGIVLCYLFLIRRLGMDAARARLAVLAFFAGGYGVYTFCMAGTVESYMVLAMSARLFFSERRLGTRDIWKLAVIDAVLISLKAYSLVFLVATWPLVRTSGRGRIFYGAFLVIILLALVLVKLWLWNPIYASAISNISFADSLSHLVQQLISPWTGLLFCLPILMTLFWCPPAQYWPLLFKSAGLLGCAALFSLYPFFDGDVSGGRYIFPFVVALLPEISVAVSRVLDRAPRAAWLLPVLVFTFLPVAGLAAPFFPDGVMPAPGPCYPEHPAIRSWRIVFAKAADSQEVAVCFHGKQYVMNARDVSSPRLGPWRVAYMLEGGHSPGYRAVAHDKGQQQHNAWGTRLAGLLKSMGLGYPWFWMLAGLTPAIVALWLSIEAAMRINRPGMFLRQAQ